MEEEERKEEEIYLSDCIRELERIIAEIEVWLVKPSSGIKSERDTERELRRWREEELEEALEAKPSPYFGRVDFQEEGQTHIDRYYFGKYGIPKEKCLLIIDWRAPVAHLFYNDPEKTKSYKVPNGEIKGNITLKREFEIINSKLMQMFTLYRLLPPGVEVKRLRESPVLTKSLENSKEFELEDIVATIQKEQHDKIAAKRDQVMIIEGVAGSGKSEVGLHRVAYLAYPGREISEKISPEKVIFLGPTRVFLGFISNLLPGLRVQRVKQTTIQEWLIGTLSRRIRLQQKDKLLEKYLANNIRNLENEIEVAHLKSSLKMARLLARYVKGLHKKFLNSASQIDIDSSTSISRARVQHLLKAPFEYPLNEERARVVALIDTEISKIRRLHSKEYSPAIRKNVQIQFDKFWPKANFREVYKQILSEPNALKEAAKGLLNDEELEIFTKFGLSKAKTLTYEDLPALCHLDHLINVRPNAGFEHVVIDEAQDVSPLEFLLLYEQSRNKSFTILGDLAQCLVP